MNTKSVALAILGNGDGNVKLNFMLSVLQATAQMPLFIFSVADSLVSRARNVAAASFLKTDYEYLLFWDADIVCNKEHIPLLAETEADILCGIYPKKQKELSLVLQTLDDQKGPMPCGGVIEIARGGTGFMRIHRRVFEALKRPEIEYDNHGELQWDFFRVCVQKREFLSEDWTFSDDARERGFKVMLDTRIQLRHEGNVLYPI